MFGSSQFLLRFYVLGSLFYSSSAWEVNLPRHINGLLNSCLVIPCSFDYYQYPPSNSHRVVWYQYVNRGYPLVYDSWYPRDVINIFRDKTNRYSSTFKSCSLMIYPVTKNHHRQRIYPWVDPENVGSSTYKFYETTVTINVQSEAEEPRITIVGDKKVGKSVEVQCEAYHTCPYSQPKLELNIPPQSHSQSQYCKSDGVCTTTLKTIMYITSDQQTVRCKVIHRGGLTASTSVSLNAECSFLSLTISPTSTEFLEGQASTVTCTASYTCSQDEPVLTWNYDRMPVSTSTKKISDAQWNTVSTLIFTASANDNGKSLICYANKRGQRQENSITLRVKRNMLARGWSITTPSSLTGMRGSCMIIPCSFSYTKSQPTNLRVIWYLYKSNEYPTVYDQNVGAINEFSGITSLTGSVGERNCSLKITKLEMNHNGDRLYPWIDEHSITSYQVPHTELFEKTTQLIVTNQVQEPRLNTTSVPRVGEEGRVSCSVHHTCITSPPVLALEGLPGKDVFMDSLVSDGVWQRTIERTWTVQETDQSVKCTVTYSGGQKATSDLRLKVECPYEDIKMVEPPGEVTEGMAKRVICSVSYKCKKNKPNIVWNYKDMQSFFSELQISSNTYKMESNLTFIGSLDDDGKPLTCTAKFDSRETSASEILHVKKYELYDQTDYIESGEIIPDSVRVPLKFSALTRSCVVIPCSFQPQDEPFTRGIWSKKSGGVVYHNAQSNVLNHFRARTKMLGNLNEGNCSLEIDDIKPFDNGPFCFHVQRDNVNYRFNKNCVFIVMKASPDKPMISPVPTEVDAGAVLRVSCSVTHTCPSNPPQFSWSVQNLTSETTHSSEVEGVWQTTSSISFEVDAEDGVQSLTCTAIFWRGKQQASTVPLNVKGSLMLKVKRSLPVAIPVSLLVVIVIISAVVFGSFIYKKRKHSNNSLEPPPRPEKRRSLWDRLSRRYPEDRERPPRPEKRRSIWSRISGGDGRLGWRGENKSRMSFWNRFSRHQGHAANLSVGYQNNTETVSYHNNVSKPRCPSPKSNRKTPYRPEDYQVYDYN